MSDIKSIVGLLSKLVNSFFDSNLKAEYFRLSKYDKAEDGVVPIFWDVLNNCCKKNHNDNIVTNVKLYFAGLMYKSAEFYSLPEDMSRGSRELLLAFSWLIANKNTLETILLSELAKSDISKEFNSISNPHFKNSVATPPLKSIQDYLNYILYISGKINNNLKESAEYNTKTLQLTTKVHKDTFHAKNISHLSIVETCLVKNEDFRSYLNKIQNVSHMLDTYFKWKGKESYFWEWMATVLKEKGKDKKKHIDIQILNTFFLTLRNHVKILLTKSKPRDEPIVQIDNTRCIYAPDFTEKLPQTNTKNLEQIQKQNERNLNGVTDFLSTFL